MLDPRRCSGFNSRWNSFAWVLKWALEQFPRDAVRYLEWGSGWSTTYASTYVLPNNIYCVEDVKEWYDRYKDLGINIVLRRGPERGDHDTPTPQEWYDPFPGAAKFDVILVDGHARRDECVVSASTLIGEDGFVIVHDTWDSAAHRRAAVSGADAGLEILVDIQAGPGTILLARANRDLRLKGLTIGPIE
jgi:hypothetical protein